MHAIPQAETRSEMQILCAPPRTHTHVHVHASRIMLPCCCCCCCLQLRRVFSFDINGDDAITEDEIGALPACRPAVDITECGEEDDKEDGGDWDDDDYIFSTVFVKVPTPPARGRMALESSADAPSSMARRLLELDDDSEVDGGPGSSDDDSDGDAGCGGNIVRGQWRILEQIFSDV